MAKEWAKDFYKSSAWKKCREGFIKSVYGLCQRCGKPGHIVHHKEVLTQQNINDPILSRALANKYLKEIGLVSIY